MDGIRPTGALSDSTLENEVERALAVDPSPEFLARIRARVAHEPAPAAWRLTWKPAGAFALSMGLALVAAIVMWQGPDTTPATERANVSSKPVDPPENSAGSSGSAGSGLAIAATSTIRATVSGRRRGRASARRVEPEVLISTEEAAALRQLFGDITERRIDPSLLREIAPSSMPLPPIQEIAIEPIAVSPLAPISGE